MVFDVIAIDVPVFDRNGLAAKGLSAASNREELPKYLMIPPNRRCNKVQLANQLSTTALVPIPSASRQAANLNAEGV